MDSPPDLLTVAEVADLWRVDKATVYRFCSSGQLRHTKLSAQATRIQRADAEAFFAARTVPAGDAV